MHTFSKSFFFLKMSLRNAVRYVRDYDMTAATIKLAFQNRRIAEEFRFEKIRPHHLPLLMDLSRGFFEDESLTSATRSTIDSCKKMMEFVHSYSIAAQNVVDVSMICYHRATNLPVGFRLSHPVYRDESKAPFTIPPLPEMNKQEAALFAPLDDTFNQVWKIFPDEEVVYKGEICYIDRRFRSAGLFQSWVDYDLNFPEISKVTGARFFGAVGTAKQTKGLYEKRGFRVVYTSPSTVIDRQGNEIFADSSTRWGNEAPSEGYERCEHCECPANLEEIGMGRGMNISSLIPSVIGLQLHFE